MDTARQLDGRLLLSLTGYSKTQADVRARGLVDVADSQRDRPGLGGGGLMHCLSLHTY